MLTFANYQHYTTLFDVDRAFIRRVIAICEPLIIEALDVHVQRHLWQNELPVYPIMTAPPKNGGWSHLMPFWFKPQDRPIPFYTLNNWVLFALVYGHSFGPSDEARELVRQTFTYKSMFGAINLGITALATLCEQANIEQVPFLTQTFRRKTPGKHSNDRHRLALQALGGVAARSGNEEALLVLEEGLNHHKKDTRGWAIGFLLDSYIFLNRPFPQSVISRLHILAENDISADVRVEAIMALAGMELVFCGVNKPVVI